MYFMRPQRPRDRRLVAGDARPRRRAQGPKPARSRARGHESKNEDEDLRMAEELKRNEKERAERVVLGGPEGATIWGASAISVRSASRGPWRWNGIRA